MVIMIPGNTTVVCGHATLITQGGMPILQQGVNEGCLTTGELISAIKHVSHRPQPKFTMRDHEDSIPF